MLKSIHWGSLLLGIAIAWFGLPLLQTMLSKVKSAA